MLERRNRSTVPSGKVPQKQKVMPPALTMQSYKGLPPVKSGIGQNKARMLHVLPGVLPF